MDSSICLAGCHWRDATRRHKDPRRRGKALGPLLLPLILPVRFFNISHAAEKPGTTPGQIIMTNTKFQRDSLAQSLPRVKFPQPVPNPLYSPSASQGTDDTHTLAPPAKRAKQAKGSGGKPRDMYQVTHLTEVPTRLESVVKLSGSTCYRAIMIKMHVVFSQAVSHVETVFDSKVRNTSSLPQSSDVKPSHVPM